ncbi:Rv1893 family protein, partial [Mycobacterium kansasii]
MIGKRIQDNIEAVTKIAADSVRKSGEIVEGAG